MCKKTASIYLDTALTQKMGEAPYQTRLPLLEEKNGVLEVWLPDGNTGYLSGSDTKNERDLTFSRAGIVSEAKQFLDLPYLWAGASSYGFDCSGFVMRLYQSQGITIPRDADDQALAGTAVDRDNLLPGDLVFFATLKGTGQIHHVGMYIGDGQMIHAPTALPQSASITSQKAIMQRSTGGHAVTRHNSSQIYTSVTLKHHLLRCFFLCFIWLCT